jgi:hypothetical protein
MPEGRCLNCDSAFESPAIFCPRCAQRTDTGRISLRDVGRDLLQTFVNVERGPLAFAWALLRRPGTVAREYVEGKRRRHYGPFATLVVLVGLTALAINWTGFQVLSNDGLPPGPTSLLQRHFNLLLLVQLPLQGAACAALFRAARLTWPEHMVLAAYTLGVRAVFIALLAPFASFAGAAPGPASTYAFWAAWYLYFGWAASQFYDGPRRLSWLRGALAAALTHLAVIALLFVGSAAYEAVVVR